MSEAFVFDAIRTPRGKGKKDGSLHEVKPVNLLAGLLTELQRRNDFDTAQVDDVVMGIVSPVGEQGSVLPKVAALKAGWDFRCAGVQLNRFCASGLEAVNMAAQKVRSGWEDLVVAGGVESMSRVPIGSDGGAWAQDPETNSATLFVPQGIGADLIATIEGSAARTSTPSRSNRRSAPPPHARRPATSPHRWCRSDFLGQTILDFDEFIKPRTTMEGLAALKPAFEQMGAMGFDAGGAAALPAGRAHPPCAPCRQFVGHRRWRRGDADRLRSGRQDAQPHAARAHRRRRAVSGADPTIMLTGPMPAARKALAKAGMTIDQIDLFEVNEAFAAVPMRFMKEMGVPHEKVNVNGGAIAMGHPLGATGAMILNTLIDELHRRKLRYGLATLCVGGGMGIATIVERI
jgi:acetyl-CoA C-acetyltransferase